MLPAREKRARRPARGDVRQNLGHKRTSIGLITCNGRFGPAPGQPHRYLVQRPPPSSRAHERSLLATVNRDCSLLAQGTGREGSWPIKAVNKLLVSSSTCAAVSLRTALLAIAIASRIAWRKVASH